MPFAGGFRALCSREHNNGSQIEFHDRMALEPSEQQYLTAAEGFLALGMLEDANAEIEKIDPFCRHLPEVCAVRLSIYLRAQNWELAETLAARLRAADPANPQWHISLAYAVRRLSSIAAAKPILIDAAERHPNEPIIHYNLSCYECQLGDLSSAREHLKKAIALAPECRLMALDDEDLQPLWDRLSDGVLD